MRCRGFTLIEVVVALAVAALVMLLARGVAGAMTDAQLWQSEASAVMEQRALARAMTRELAALAHTSGDSARFFGTSRSASFTSACQVPGGWREPCSVTLRLATDSAFVALMLPRGERQLVLDSGFAHGSLHYLKSAAGGGSWQAQWSDARALPLALAVVTDRDTTIVSLGVDR